MVVTTYAERSPGRREPARLEWVGATRARLAALVAERRAAARIARLGPRLAADAGLDPEPVRAEGWDALRPNPLLVATPIA